MLLAALFASAPAGAVVPTLIFDTFGTPVPGEPITLRFWGLVPGNTGVIAGGDGVSPGATCPAQLPFCLDVTHAVAVGSGVADNVGSIELQAVVPETVTLGSTVAFQGVAPATGEVSSAFGYAVSDHVEVFGVWDDPTGALPQVEIDDQAMRDSIKDTELSDFDNANDQGFSSWLRPNGWSYWERFDWTSSGGSLWLCRSMPQTSEAAVRRLGPADRSSPATGGCTGAPWTELVPAEPEIAGQWRDPQGRRVDIDRTGVTLGAASYTASRFSNEGRSMIAVADPGSPQAGRWARLDWTVDAAGQTSVCATRTGALTEWDARSTLAADPNDLQRGCRGGPWIPLR